jgi:hypothetical protein
MDDEREDDVVVEELSPAPAGFTAT